MEMKSVPTVVVSNNVIYASRWYRQLWQCCADIRFKTEQIHYSRIITTFENHEL